MKSFVSVHQARQLDRQVYVHGRIKTMNESIYYNVDDIHTAIARNKKIRFKYFAWNTDKSMYILNHGDYMTVSPWALTWDDENYYLIAFDDYSQNCKHYRVDKMLKLEVLEDLREGKDEFKSFDMAAYTKATFGMYSGEKTRVIIEFHNHMCGVFIDRFGKDITIRPVDEKHCEVSVEVNVSPQFFGWIFSLGKDVKLTGPGSAVEAMRKYAEEFLANY